MSKKLYIYNYLDKITMNYHNGGGLVIVTASDPSVAWQARNARIAADRPSKERYVNPDYIIQELPKPDHVITVPDDTPDSIIEFPDAGCC